MLAITNRMYTCPKNRKKKLNLTEFLFQFEFYGWFMCIACDGYILHNNFGKIASPPYFGCQRQKHLHERTKKQKTNRNTYTRFSRVKKCQPWLTCLTNDWISKLLASWLNYCFNVRKTCVKYLKKKKKVLILLIMSALKFFERSTWNI